MKLSTIQEKALLAIGSGYVANRGLIGFRTSTIRSLAREALVTYPKLAGGHFYYRGARLTVDGQVKYLALTRKKAQAHGVR